MTCLGINNEGQLVFDYYHEDIDEVGGANVYNGQDSALWVNFREAFWDEIGELYRELRSDKKLTFEAIYDAFITNQSDKWSISVYNEDADYKYISMLRSDNDASNLDQIRGSGKEHLGYFVDNRLKYLDSEFEAAEYLDNYATLRIYTPDTWTGVAPNADVTVTPFSNMYAGIRYKANGTPQYHRAEKNVPVTFDAPDEKFNDTETAVFGASEISSLGDLSPLYCGSVKVANATKLTEIIVGSAVTGYSNPNMKELVVGTNRLLKKVDVRNCPNLTAPLALSGCPNIEEVYAEGTSITGVELPASGYLKTMHLPATITNLTVRNQPYIEDFRCAGYGNLTTLRVENTSGIPVSDVVNGATNLNRVRLLNVDLQLTDASVLHRLAACGGLDESNNNADKPVVIGKAHVNDYLTQSELEYFETALPDLDITYLGLKVQYTVTFANWDGTVLDTQYVEAGEDAVEPIAAGRISTPTKQGDAQYSYTFSRWLGTYTNVSSSRTITADFTSSINKYTVTFYNGETMLQTSTVEYGSAADYVGGQPEYNGDGEGVMAFAGWSADTSNVVGDMNVYAVFLNIADSANVQTFADASWELVKAVADNGELNSDGDWAVGNTVWWSVGDEKTITIEGYGELIFQIYDFMHDTKVDGTKAAFTLGLKNVLPDYTIFFDESLNTWYNSDLRAYLRDTIYNNIEKGVQDLICEVYKDTLGGGTTNDTNVYSSTETLFALSFIETNLTTDTLLEGTPYPIFTDNASRVKYNGSTSVWWWLRTPDTSNSKNVYEMSSNGSKASSNNVNSNNRYLCFAFCI